MPSDPASQRAAVSEAFSRKSRHYDAFGEQHPILERMRGKIRAHVLDRLRPGMQLLELNAGTGSDAVFFARQGYAVHATDIAPGMLHELRLKAADPALAGRLTVQECSFTSLESVQGAPYDFVFSDMGGLNCVPNLDSLRRGLSHVLRVGGQVSLVIMPPVCLWELAHLQFRRWRKEGTRANVEGVSIMTYYHPLTRVQRDLGPSFRLLSVQGISVFTPAADQKDFPLRHPQFYRFLRALDERLADWPILNTCGDFYQATFQRAFA